jgi:branched-subunit amino acid aminotransferase/4-amino-4-deoxychorismate lyase
MNPAWLWTGEGFEPCAGVPLSDRGFRYGLSLFETVCIRKGLPLFLPAHLARLKHACADHGFGIDANALAAIERVLEHAGIEHGAARIYVTAGDGGTDARPGECRVFVAAESRDLPDAALYGNGYRLHVARHPHQPIFSGEKTGNYWANLAALDLAREGGFNEALLFNGNGELSSACMANVFIVTDGKIRTPSRDNGARQGIVRDWVLRNQADVEETTLTKDEVLAADELFLTNSWLGVMPVAALDDRSLSTMQTGARLHADYERAVAELTQ